MTRERRSKEKPIDVANRYVDKDLKGETGDRNAIETIEAWRRVRQEEADADVREVVGLTHESLALRALHAAAYVRDKIRGLLEE